MLDFLERSGIVVMLISGFGTYAAIYIYLGNTPKIKTILEKRWGEGEEGERDRKADRESKREDKVPNIPQMFPQTI